jgi:hypothetical protein
MLARRACIAPVKETDSVQPKIYFHVYLYGYA